MDKLFYDYSETTIGTLLLMASEHGLQAIFHDNCPALPSLQDATQNQSLIAPYAKAINAYLDGSLKELHLSIAPSEGTQLQQLVWQELRRIPYGETINYSELAKQIDHGDAVRAVASACARNPLPIVIPCHRVISKDGKTGEFIWGAAIKKALLQLESSASPIHTLVA